jgi:hypothetical protein
VIDVRRLSVPSGALQRGQQGASGADSGLPASMSTPLPRTMITLRKPRVAAINSENEYFIAANRESVA